MQLVIAEKPSVARDLGRVLGLRGKGRNTLEGADRVITWCIGHLVELEEPASYDGRWKAWRLDTLPMIPGAFKLRPVDSTRAQLATVRELLRDRRFTEVVNACDAGREGELIFRYVYDLAGSRLPVRRLWISSMTDEAIHRGFAALRPGAELDALADAARCRSEADWLVGMNATRAVTLRFRDSDLAAPPRGGGRSPVYSIGRVQTPTLALVVRREQAIRAFQPRDYWEVRGSFAASSGADLAPDAAGGPPGAAGAGEGSFTALWTLRPPPRGGTKGGAITRFGARPLADGVVARAAGDPAGPVVETLAQKRSREAPPLLFDLTSLQRTANRRYGMSASRTLEVAQALYERHKLLTYPRTDSRHLSGDLAGELPKLFRGLGALAPYAPFVAPLLASPPARGAPGSRRVFDDAKVQDHHAIIPTGKVAGVEALDRDEGRIFDLVARRFLGAFHPDAEFALTEAVIRVGAPDHGAAAAGRSGPAPAEASAPDETLLEALPPAPDRFVARGRVRLVAGWQAVAQIGDESGRRPDRAPGRKGDENERDGGGGGGAGGDDDVLPPLAEGQRLTGRFEPVARQTRPPPRHTEATLLGAMEYAGREIEDEALRAAMKDTGLGTPATRAATIETLLARGFITRQGKQIVPTSTGIGLIDRLPVPTLGSPELTGAWEARLARIARRQDTRTAFMADIARYVGDVIAAVRARPAGPANGPAMTAKATGAAAPAPAPARPARPAERTAPAAVTAGAEALALTCPRCRQGAVVAGKRGWGCARWREGCPFVVWFEVAGRRLTSAQLRDLVEKGKTRKGKWAQPGGAPATGRLVLDLQAPQSAGAARFEPGDP